LNKKIFIPGRYLFAAAVLALGIIHLATQQFPSELMPVPTKLPGKIVWVYIAGFMLIAGGVGLMFKGFRFRAATLLVLQFFIFLSLLYIPWLINKPYNPNAWTTTFEMLALLGGALMIMRWIKTGSWLFAITMIIFGVQHLMYSDFILTLVPGWVPAPVLWLYIVKIAFFAIPLSIFLNVKKNLAALLSASMFLGWVVLLHIPRVIQHPQNEPEWTSLFIALAMTGISLLLIKPKES
jgi:uncharacterized membrane protein